MTRKVYLVTKFSKYFNLLEVFINIETFLKFISIKKIVSKSKSLENEIGSNMIHLLF